jgi:N,N'-diacetyllegionaminate synthase
MKANHTVIIAEAGVNHNGDLNIAKKLVDIAAEAGADYVKFQTYKASALVSKAATKAQYQIKNIGDVEQKSERQLDMLKKLELSEADHYELISHCKKRDIQFFSTAFDLGSLDFLKKLGLNLFKIPSGELTNLPYLEKIATLSDQIILSTGMSTMQEIGAAIEVIKKINPAVTISVLHCNTEYPTPYHDVNLRAMNSIGLKFDVAIGYSDHTLGIEVPIAAVALGAKIIEKHFTLSRTMSGPDHAASLEPRELSEMVRAIRNIESALGSKQKSPSTSEFKNIAIARKSVHLCVDKLAGEELKASDFEMLRPGDGISPMCMNDLIGKKVNRNLLAGHKLIMEDIII